MLVSRPQGLFVYSNVQDGSIKIHDITMQKIGKTLLVILNLIYLHLYLYLYLSIILAIHL